MSKPLSNKLKKAVRLTHIDYWLNSANHDLDVAETLFQNEKYDWCLFIAHLVLEKTLKEHSRHNNILILCRNYLSKFKSQKLLPQHIVVTQLSGLRFLKEDKIN